MNKFATAYVDNILIYLINEIKYELYIKKVLNKFKKAELQVNIRKYKFYTKETRFLGFIIGVNGIRVNKTKI